MNAADRRTYLGASDAAAVLGMSRWKTPLEVWAEKTGRLEQPDISELMRIKLGFRLEEVVAEQFTMATKKKVHRTETDPATGEPKMYVHPRHPFLVCHTDFDLDDEDAVLQCKTAAGWKAKEWEGEEIPREYIIQEMAEMMVSGKKTAYIAVLIGNEEFKWRKIERDETMIEEMRGRMVRFWEDFVMAGVMPAAVTANDMPVLVRLFPTALPGKTVQLDGRADIIADSIKAMQQDYDSLEGLIDKEKNALRLMLGDAEVGDAPAYKISWKNEGKSSIDTELLKIEAPEIYEKYCRKGTKRVLRITKKKQK